MSNAIARIWKELAEVSASLSCAKNKLTSKLDALVADIEEADKTKKGFNDAMFDTRKEAERSKEKIAEVEELVQRLQGRISEVKDLTAPLPQPAAVKGDDLSIVEVTGEI